MNGLKNISPIVSELNIKATPVFEKTWEALESDCRYIESVGGSRSSKTWSIIQALIIRCLQKPLTQVSIIRKTFPALRATVLRDFIEVMRDLELYDPEMHSKSENIYNFSNGSWIEFFSADDEQKLRGRKRDIAWCNEANELHYDDFQQITLRTTEKLIFDYNPSMTDSWIYHINPDRTYKIHSTYKDNPFLGKEIIEEIESYKERDPDYYTIFALGQRAYSKENVYAEWKQCPRPPELTEWVYAIDFGYTHPTALIKLWYHPDKYDLWLEELIYESHLTSGDLIGRMQDLGVDKSKTIVADGARPEIISDIKRAGWKCIAANKAVQDGIMAVKSFRVGVDPAAHNIIQENYNYRYKKQADVILEEPIKLWDDAMDAIRYGAMWIKKWGLKRTNSRSNIYTFNL